MGEQHQSIRVLKLPSRLAEERNTLLFFGSGLKDVKATQLGVRLQDKCIIFQKNNDHEVI